MLFEAVYSRLAGAGVVVLTDQLSDPAADPAAVRNDGLRVVRRPLASSQWGVLNVDGLRHHLRVARETRKLGSRREVIVHCGRALPEGTAAWLSWCAGGPDYICWTHGEDIGTALQSRELTWVMTRVYRNASANIANSRNSGRMLEDLGVPTDRIRVIYPGVDVRRFRPDIDASDLRAKFGGATDTILLSVGRLQRRKGHDTVIRAIARLPSRQSVRYLIIGEGDERRRLEALAASCNVADRVHFLGEVPAADLPRYYAACDVFLLPNRIDNGDVEGFGIVFLEAAATARPVIGGRTGGVPEAVVENETGVLVSGTDVEELAAAIGDLADSERKRCDLGTRGRERVCRFFTWERTAEQVLALHHEVAGFAG